jgi:glutamate-1-semialdehyde 2,1-aminomutase
MGTTWEVREEDRGFFERELESFVPDRVYDMHAHLWRVSDWEGRPPEVVTVAPEEVTLEVYRECMGWILPGREVHGLHFPYPASFPNNPVPCNEWVSQEIKKDALARGQFYVRPTDDPERVREEVKRLGLRGFKPFAAFAERPDKVNAEIPEFFPEWMARIAHEEGWSVTLHMMRRRSLADPSNQHWIRTYCGKYPDMTLIVDHGARGFNPYHAVEGLAQMQDLPNLYADTSAVCSPLAVIACLEYLGVQHVLYASDFYCSHLRGTNLPVGDSFLWLEEDMPVWDMVLYQEKPVLLGLESLRAIKSACEILHLTDSQVEAIFWDNAARLLQL